MLPSVKSIVVLIYAMACHLCDQNDKAASNFLATMANRIRTRNLFNLNMLQNQLCSLDVDVSKQEVTNSLFDHSKDGPRCFCFHSLSELDWCWFLLVNSSNKSDPHLFHSFMCTLYNNTHSSIHDVQSTQCNVPSNRFKCVYCVHKYKTVLSNILCTHFAIAIWIK